MAKSQRKNEASGKGRIPSTENHDGPDLLQLIVRSLLSMLIVARWLVPTESAADGGTLWLAQLTFGVAGLWVWAEFRAGEFRVRFGSLDLAFGMIVLGHVVSAIVVLMTEGDKRAAINMAWEWVSLGTLYFLLRQVMVDRASLRTLAVTIAATVVMLAGFGIWQHYVFYPSAVRDYDARRLELNQLKNAPPAATADESSRRMQRIRAIESEFYAEGVPASESGQQLFERRLRNSREPFGMFALANSFAGLLLVGFVLTLGLFADAISTGGPRRSTIMLAAAALVIAYCLLLTKSRSALVGLAAGLVVWGLLVGVQRIGTLRQQTLWWGAGAIVAGLLLFGGAVLSGGIDLEMLTEAPKSLGYRAQYWRGAAATIRESPVFGTGPGNFRQRYLKHKLAESSEEIADPHNFVLDVWAGGGLMAVVGLAAFLTLLGIANFRAMRSTADAAPATVRKDVVVGAALAFPLVLLIGPLGGVGNPDNRIVALALAWLVVIYVMWSAIRQHDESGLRSQNVCGGLSPNAVAAAVIALLVNLVAAGGIAMPAITQILVILAIFASAVTIDSRSSAAPEPESRTRFLIAAALVPIAFAGCLLSATKPVLARTASIAAGDDAVSLGGPTDRAERQYAAAAEADPFSAEPLEKLSELQFIRWEKEAGDAKDSFEQGVELAGEAIQLNPFSPYGYRRLGGWHLKRFGRTGRKEDALAAADQFAKAVERLPNQSGLRAEFADALEKGGRHEEARREAAFALDLDAINRQAGHVELYLPKEAERATRPPSGAVPGLTVEALRKLAGG
ncbi:MAG: O-antigen ligase family protein [Planctomycetaceae bacterium]